MVSVLLIQFIIGRQSSGRVCRAAAAPTKQLLCSCQCRHAGCWACF
jgi:hypothetical protein